MLTDIIRDNAPETLAFFKDQGVDLKVISGDDPVTVSAIAKKQDWRMQINTLMPLPSPHRRIWSVPLQSVPYSAV